MEIPSPEIHPVKLTAENVHAAYEAAVMKSGEYGGKRITVRDLLNDTVFDQDRLETQRPAIEQLAAQLPPQFFRRNTNGADYKDAQQDYRCNQWAESSQDINNLLAMISAIGLGRVTTPGEIIFYNPPKNRDNIFYLIDKDSYQQNR
jgi:hypothetical protein